VPENNTDATVVWEIPASVNGIATDLLGNVYVTDGAAIFSKYDANGKLLGSWSGGLTYTTGIAVDGQGNIYVANFEPPVIHKFTPDGNPSLTWTIADGIGPVGLAVDLQGNLYVALHRIHDHYIEKYDPQGKLLGTWAKPDTAGGQIKAGPFTGPGGMAIDTNGDNYITDDEQAHKYDKDGNLLYSIPKRCSIALDSQGNLYLVFYEGGKGNSILKFDRNGKQIGKWSVTIPSLHPEYSYGIAMDHDGNIFLNSNTVLAKIKLPAQ
jgi:DNA-binding beta-propeller fold protein YncE